MRITVSRHVFGSIRGYTTLAKSKDLSPEETAELEILSFGQTNESSYLSSLQTSPAYISRPLRSGQWAVTRVFQGKPDEHNRTTLLFISAVITVDDWLSSLKCDVKKLLYCPSIWRWNGEEKLNPIEITVKEAKETPTDEIREKVLSLLGAVEKYTGEKNTSIVVRASKFDGEVLTWLNMVLPLSSKLTFSCAARSLSDGLPFTLISMAKEGSLGNSKRRTIDWMPNSTVNDCPYTESLTEFWQPGSEPPWQFIDRCQSFSIDMETKPEPALRERFVMRKPLYAEVAKPRRARKRYFSRKLAIILFACAMVACLTTVITIAATRFKTNKKVRSLIEGNIKEAENFLVRNSPRAYFPVDRAAREQAIKQGEHLKYQVEALFARTNDAGLEKVNSKLEKWLNSAQDAHERYDFVDRLPLDLKVLKSKTKRGLYPDSNIILHVEGLKDAISKINKANLDPKYVSRTKESVYEEIDRWQEEIKKVLLAKKAEVANTIQLRLPQTQTPYYSEQQYKKYGGFRKELQGLQEDETLMNASQSPMGEHQEIAKGATDQLDMALANCNSTLEKMDEFKKKAEASFNDANGILNNPNITDGSVENFSRLKKAKSCLDNAAKLWPDKPALADKDKQLHAKFEKNKENTFERWKEEIEKIEKQDVPDHPNNTRINELYKTVKAKLLNANMQNQNIDDILQEIKDFDEKLKKQSSSISKSKRKRHKPGK